MLHWTIPSDGEKSLRSLDFEVENTSDRAITVDLHITSSAGNRSSERRGPSVTVNPRARVAQAIGVEQLGVQLAGGSVSTLIMATYQGQDGLTRSMPLPNIWVEHDPGFVSARVRSPTLEAKKNAERGFANLFARRPSAGRVVDAATGRASALADLADFALASGAVAQLPEFPDPAQYQIPKVASVTSDIPDAERDLTAADAAEGTFDKGGNFSICLRTPYGFVDSTLGEDYLTGLLTGWTWEPAHYQAAMLATPSGSLLWAGYLNASGCTPLVNHPNGNYAAWTTTSLYVPDRDVAIDVLPTQGAEHVWGATGYTISSSGGTITLNMGAFDSIEQLDATVAAANTLYRATTAYPNGTQTGIVTTQGCRGSQDPAAAEGCFDASNNIVWLGKTKPGWSVPWFKVVTEHELGHRVQNALLGFIPNPYTVTTNLLLCRCDHVTSVTNKHCLQSRHDPASAQVEGWGHFFAATNLNNGLHSDCVFPYYKEFKKDFVTILQPPNVQSCFDQIRWRQNNCPGNGQGVEWDWMNFYWRLNKKDNYSFANFRSVYQQACGGSCTASTSSWTSLATAANTAFGVGTTKATAWANAGTAYGAAN